MLCTCTLIKNMQNTWEKAEILILAAWLHLELLHSVHFHNKQKLFSPVRIASLIISQSIQIASNLQSDLHVFFAT